MNIRLLESKQTSKEPVMVVRGHPNLVHYHIWVLAELDEMWSFVRSKRQQRWLWRGTQVWYSSLPNLGADHRSGQVLACVLAPHEDAALVQLQQLLAPFGIEHFYTGVPACGSGEPSSGC